MDIEITDKNGNKDTLKNWDSYYVIIRDKDGLDCRKYESPKKVEIKE